MFPIVSALYLLVILWQHVFVTGFLTDNSETRRTDLQQNSNDTETAFGNFYNYWLTDGNTSFDLTRGNLTGSKVLKTDTANITISPSRSAMVIVDMQSEL